MIWKKHLQNIWALRNMKNKKLFIVRKYVMAKDAKDAIRVEKSLPVDDVWVDDDWKKNNAVVENKVNGFKKK